MNSLISDEELDQNRIAGELLLVFEFGTNEEKESLSKCLRYLFPEDHEAMIAKFKSPEFE